MRVKNARVRFSERSRIREEQGQEMDHKRRKLDDIEDAAMNENDPEQLEEYEEY